MAAFDETYRRLSKFMDHSKINGLAKRIMEKKIAETIASIDTKTKKVNLANAIREAIQDFSDMQTENREHVKKFLVIIKNSHSCNDCVNNLQGSLDLASVQNVEISLVTHKQQSLMAGKQFDSAILHNILYDEKVGIESVSLNLLSMMHKLLLNDRQ
uniref:VWFA domain-containing protein n=1 Tax=Romanomermis culicivorax TaxID=13658 RepID=A0A915KG95_ROMCU